MAALSIVADPARARRYIAQALSIGWWMNCLQALAKIDPDVIATIADDRIAICESALQLDAN